MVKNTDVNKEKSKQQLQGESRIAQRNVYISILILPLAPSALLVDLEVVFGRLGVLWGRSWVGLGEPWEGLEPSSNDFGSAGGSRNIDFL